MTWQLPCTNSWQIARVYIWTSTNLFWQTQSSSQIINRSEAGLSEDESMSRWDGVWPASFEFVHTHSFVCENKPWAQRRRLRSGVCRLRHSPDVSSCHKGSINLTPSRSEFWPPASRSIPAVTPKAKCRKSLHSPLAFPLRGLQICALSPVTIFCLGSES